MQPVLAPLSHHFLERLLHQRVQPRGGLVKHEQLGVICERSNEGDLLPVALRVVADPLRRVEVEPLDEGGPATLVQPAPGGAEDIETLPPGEPRPERDVASHVGEALVERRSVMPRVRSEELDVPATRSDEAEDHTDRRRLARSVGTDEAVDLSLRDLEVEPVKGVDGAIALGQPLRADDREDCTHSSLLLPEGVQRAIGGDGVCPATNLRLTRGPDSRCSKKVVEGGSRTRC